LLKKMPAVYGEPSGKPDSTTTRFRVISGSGAAYEHGAPPKPDRIAEQCLLVIRVGETNSVPWTQPEEVEFDPLRPQESLGLKDELIYAVNASGSAMALRPSLSDDLLRALIAPSNNSHLLIRQELPRATVNNPR
jgi:hypothetical protein